MNHIGKIAVHVVGVLIRIRSRSRPRSTPALLQFCRALADSDSFTKAITATTPTAMELRKVTSKAVVWGTDSSLSALVAKTKGPTSGAMVMLVYCIIQYKVYCTALYLTISTFRVAAAVISSLLYSWTSSRSNRRWLENGLGYTNDCD
jgi:hypothetical protein